jgi:hypothetical protein
MDPRHLRMLGLAVAIVAAGTGIYLFTSKKEQIPKEDPAEKAQAVARREKVRKSRDKVVPDLRVPLRPIDREILALAAKGFPGPDQVLRDALPKAAVNVNLIKDKPSDDGRVHQARLDLDRNTSTDEVWRFKEGGVVERDVTFEGKGTRDSYVLDGDAWKLTKGEGATAGAAPRPRELIMSDLRPLDREILALARKGINGSRSNDVLPGRDVRVDLQRGKQPSVNRVEIDFDRDGMLDEHWSLGPGGVRRFVSPADNGKFTEQYELKGDQWSRIE